MTPENRTPQFRLVTALEIIRAYADAYAEVSFTLAMASQKCTSDAGALQDSKFVAILQAQLEKLLNRCEHLPVTSVKVKKILVWLQHAEATQEIVSSATFSHSLMEIQDRMVDELSTKLFFQLPFEKHQMFEEPTRGLCPEFCGKVSSAFSPAKP